MDESLDTPTPAAVPRQQAANAQEARAMNAGQAKGHFERTRDGVTWEPVKTKDMRDFMAGTFRDTRTAIEQMRKNPGTERQLSFYGTFRYMIDTAQEAA